MVTDNAALILVVDDDDLNRLMLVMSLEEDGHQVLQAGDGVEALAILASEPVDVVLLDILMPRLNGFGVLERRHVDPELRSIPFIVISGSEELTSVVRCIEMGAEDYLPKPFDPVLLRARIGACLEKKRLRDQEVAYLHTVDEIIHAAAAVEQGDFRPESIDHIVARDDALGRWATVFQQMARRVEAREQELRQQLRSTRYVFVSYSSADRERVEEIVRCLEGAGFQVWLDRHDIAGGMNYGTQIVQSIRSCAALVIACSETSVQSRNVRQEIQLAWKYKRPYLPLLLEPVTFPDELEYWLEGWQWVPVLNQPAEQWLPQVAEALLRLGIEADEGAQLAGTHRA